MRRLLLAVSIASVSLLSSTAFADTFNFSVIALGASTSGSLTATNNSDGSFTVTGISGNGIIGLIAANDPFFGNDNLLLPSNPRSLDVNGLAFTEMIASQLYSVDVFSTVSGFQVLARDSGGNVSFGDATFSVNRAATVTPEPSSLILLGTGLLGSFITTRRRHA